MIIDAANLELAVHRFRARNPRYFGMKFILLPERAKETILADAARLGAEQ